MKKIRELINIDLSKPIEEVIKLSQQDEKVVYTELTEYVATDSIRDHYRRLLKAIADSKQEPQEGVGVWISGFFGSGKSAFAKNLGYVLANRIVLGKSASDLFNERIDDKRVAEYLDFINKSIPIEVVMFDVAVDRSTLNQSERLAEVMYRVLLRELDYAEDWVIANLEISLEADGRLEEFIQRFEQKYTAQFGEKRGSWRLRRKLSTRHSEASAILHEIDPSTYTRPDSWAESPAALAADITVRRLIEDTFELMARRRPGKAAIYIIDEVGQYVARSADKILDLQAIVREMGSYGRNMVVKRDAVAPVWILVTSQEKLDEVVAAIDSKRVDLAKLQDSFKYHVDMEPADIREVASRRVLTKTDEGENYLRELYDDIQGQLNTYCKLERTTRRSEVSELEFIHFYPYLPHYIDLSIQIMSGIRLQPGAARHIGGANRTIIKQAYELLVNERTNLADKPIGTLVTLDRIYELVEGNLSSERRSDIGQIIANFPNDPWPARVAKTISLLEFVRDLPRTEENIAALLLDSVNAHSPIDEVNEALEKLDKGQFIRRVEEGYKLQTAQEKNWQTERQSLDPKPREENEIKRNALMEIFNDPKLKTFRYEDLRTFRVGIKVDDVAAGEEGQLTLQISVAEDEDDFNRYCEERDLLSRAPGQEQSLFWIMQLSTEAKEEIVELFRSREMIRKYNQLSASSTLTDNEKTLLNDEKREDSRRKGRLRDKLAECLYQGRGYFRGVKKDGAAEGRNSIEAVRGILNYAVPYLYDKLKIGARPLTGSEPEEVLKAANLTALPQVFYGGDGGTDLIIERQGRYLPNPEAEVAREVLGYIRRQHSYGNKVVGKNLEKYFQAMPYGWEYEMILLVLAVLLRAGAVEVTYQGHRFRNHLDPQARAPFNVKSKRAFRNASFAPREPIELRTLTKAVGYFEELTGIEIDVEESAISDAFKKLANDELTTLVPLEAQLAANQLPAVDVFNDYKATLEMVQTSPSDDCVRILAGEGKSLKEMRDQVWHLKEATNEAGLKILQWARDVHDVMWPEVQIFADDPQSFAQSANVLINSLNDNQFFLKIEDIKDGAKVIEAEYRQLYEDLHIRRGDAYQEIIEEISALEVWQNLSPDIRNREMIALVKRADTDLDLPESAILCHRCSATLSQMDSDLAAAPAHRTQIMENIYALSAPELHVERVKLADFFTGDLSTEVEIEESLERLRTHLIALLNEDIKIVLE